MSLVRYTVHFCGRVQGVGFRYTAQALARRRKVAGYVQNLPDGRVRLVAEGEKAEIDALLLDLRARMSDYIENTTLDRAEPTGEFGPPGAFDIRH